MASILFPRSAFGVYRPRFTTIRKFHPYASERWPLEGLDTWVCDVIGFDDHCNDNGCYNGWLVEDSDDIVKPIRRQRLRRVGRRKIRKISKSDSESGERKYKDKKKSVEKSDLANVESDSDERKHEQSPKHHENTDSGEARTFEIEKLQNDSISETEHSDNHNEIEENKKETTGEKESPENFKLTIAMDCFKPKDLKLTAKGNNVTVHGKYVNERDHGDGVYSIDEREFRHTYTLPDHVDVTELTSQMDEDGILTVEAPLLDTGTTKERLIPITFPENAVENKTGKEDCTHEDSDYKEESN